MARSIVGASRQRHDDLNPRRDVCAGIQDAFGATPPNQAQSVARPRSASFEHTLRIPEMRPLHR